MLSMEPSLHIAIDLIAHQLFLQGLSSYSSCFSVSVAGQQAFLKNTHTGYGPVFDSFPYWITGGQNVFFSGLTSGVASVLEFNIVP
jgi:hypothetical protein